METLYTLEYSPSQGTFHITTLEDHCQNNIRQIMNQNHDYVLIGYNNDRNKLSKLSSTLRENYPDFFKGVK